MNVNKNRHEYYYMRQAAICRNLGIKPPPRDMGLIRMMVYVYKQLCQRYSK